MRHFVRVSYLVVVYLFAFLVGSSVAWGQAATGRVFGTVVDQQAAAVPAAKVTVTNEATHVSNTATTNNEGYFEVLSLPIGSYAVTVERDGFEKYVTTANRLLINQSLKFEITLKIGTPNQTVTVESQATQVETENPTVGQSVTSRPIVDLPLNGRNVLDLALLQPGVTEKNPDAGGAGTFSVAGGRPDSVTFLLDGGLNNELMGNGVVLNPNPDTIAEFRILTSDYTAEYGRNGAGVISVVTKSGTNQIHGSAFEFARNTDFDANSYFNIIEGLPTNDLKRHQFGGTLGGPITIPHVVNGKDRFFFFFAYQGQRQTQTAVESDITTFTPTELRGDFSQEVPNGTTVTGPNNVPFTCTSAPVCPDPNVVAFLQTNPYFAAPNGNAAMGIIDPTKINSVAANYIAAGLIPSATSGLITSAATGMDNNNELTGKVDFLISSKDKLSATVGGYRNPVFAPFGLNGADVTGYPSLNQTNNYYLNIAYTRTFSAAMLNDFRVTAQRHYILGDKPATTLPPPTQLGVGITPDLPNGPSIFAFDSGLQIGYSPQGPRYEPGNTYAFADTFIWVKGRNNWKFGGGFSAYQNNTVYDFYGDGDFSFLGPYASGGIGTGNSFADFLLGIPNSLFEGPNASNDIRSKTTYAFLQDEWHVRSNLSLTLGIRYEYSTPKRDTDGRTFSIIPGDQSTRFPNAPLGLVFPGDKGAPRGVNFPDKDNFAPRIGFAWDPRNNGKTSIRGGFGIFYDVLKGEDNLQFNGAPPFYSETGPFFSCLPPSYSLDQNNNVVPCGNPQQTSALTSLSQPWTANTGFPNGSPFPSTPPTASTDFVNAGFLPLDLSGGIYFVDPHIHTPYTYQYNFSVQHQVAPSLMAEINYVGSSSKGLTALEDINPFVLGTQNRVLNLSQSPTSEVGTFCANNYSASECPFASEPEFANVSFANYNSLEASLTKQVADSRLFGTTYFTLAYTFAHSIDTASGFRNRTSQVPTYNIQQFRGPSDYDITHRISLSGDWDLPLDRAWASGPKWLLKGWALRPIFTWHTGFPLNVNGGFTFDPSNPGPSGAGDGYLANAVFASGVTQLTTYDPKSNQSGLSGACSSIRCAWYFNPNDLVPISTGDAPYGLPRNFFRGPGLTNLDMTLAKTTQIYEHLNAELRLDAFNVLNHTEFSNPDTNIFSGTFGQITGTGDPRILQVALRLNF